jgi:hypothetical protein
MFSGRGHWSLVKLKESVASLFTKNSYSGVILRRQHVAFSSKIVLNS